MSASLRRFEVQVVVKLSRSRAQQQVDIPELLEKFGSVVLGESGIRTFDSGVIAWDPSDVETLFQDILAYEQMTRDVVGC